MASEIVRGKPLSKEETKALLGFIENSKVILSKSTNATNNKIKTEEWLRITDMFNATATVHRRRPEQLRLKWENLKKNARKRSTKIKMNRIQTGGGQADYIPPDDVLDRVADLLGSTATGFVVPFGGDRESHLHFGGDGDSSDAIGDGFNGGRTEVLPITYEDGLNLRSVPVSLDVPLSIDTGTSGDPVINVATPKRLTLCTPIRGKKKSKLDDGKAARNLAIQQYFIAKKHSLDAKNENYILQNEKLKLENLKLTLELEQLQKKINLG